MKSIKRTISVFLCVILACSAFGVCAQAKTTKKYVKSISIAKKATMSLSADKKNTSKNYKVTVKVRGKASKLFTAKSSKTSVAAVKVSGSYVKVTAKKAGTAKITVTSKAKGKNGKRLSKTMALTVKKILPTKIADEKAYLNYTKYADNTSIYRYFMFVTDVLENAKSNAEYTAVTADKTVVDTAVDSKGRTIFYATGVGKTTLKIYEKLSSSAKKLIGSINIEVDGEEMSDLFNSLMAETASKDIGKFYIKMNLYGDTYDMNAVIKNLLVDNKTYKTKLKESDYSLSFDVVSGKEFIKIDDKGIITGIKNGVAEIKVSLKFSDGSETSVESEAHVSGRAIEKVAGYSMENIRDYVVGLDTPIELADGTKVPMINFDNAATTPALKAVQDAINEELKMYGSIGRSFSPKSNHSTDVYNSVRDKVLEFLTADPEFYTCFYTNSTTDGLNKLASALITKKSDIVLTTRIEHHANDLSWRERCKVIYAEVDKKGRVIYDDIEKLLKANKVKIVSLSAASNVTGYVNDVHRVARLAHKYGAKIVVDGAQIVAHRKFSMLGDLNDSSDDIDFIAFSAHKMYSPYGGGAVVGLTSVLNKHMPTFYGGGTIKVVGDYWQIYKEAPAAYEAGSPNYPGVVGLGRAIDVLSTVGMDKIEAHEKVLNRKVIDAILKYDKAIVYGDTENIDDRVGVVTFNFSDINTHFIAQKLSELGGIATRQGAFCAHPYVWRLMGVSDEEARGFENCTDLKTAGMVRLSFGIYSNEEEVDQFIKILPQVVKEAAQLQKTSLAVPEY